MLEVISEAREARFLDSARKALAATIIFMGLMRKSP
jgi:hypothetical protein